MPSIGAILSLLPFWKDATTNRTDDGAETMTQAAGDPSGSPQAPLPMTVAVVGVPDSSPVATVTAWVSEISAWTSMVGLHSICSGTELPRGEVGYETDCVKILMAIPFAVVRLPR
jgi:hypothetical protein